MLLELCAELNNYFIKDKSEDIHFGTFVISNGRIEALPFLQDGQFFRIVGSVFNDGVYCYPEVILTDETFDGAIWAMAVPPAVVALSAEIDAWNTANADVLASPYQSESFGGYSYSKASGGSSADGAGYTWKSHFANKLRLWRKTRING